MSTAADNAGHADQIRHNKKRTDRSSGNDYVNSKELEAIWGHWLETGCPKSWQKLSMGVYKICDGVASNFKPRSQDEHDELTHEAFIITINKIQNKKMVFIPGKAPVFNFITTAAIRHLYSLMNKTNHRRKLMAKYIDRTRAEPEFGIYHDNFIKHRG